MMDQSAHNTIHPLKLISVLTLISMLSGLFVVMSYEITAPMIRQNKQVALEKAVFSVINNCHRKSNFWIRENLVLELSAAESDKANIFVGYNKKGEVLAWALKGSARGYQDKVEILFAYDPFEEKIRGFKVLQSTETPGLGDKVETDVEFLKNFTALDAALNKNGDALLNPIETVKKGKKEFAWQIDGISGATVTSRAIGRAMMSSANTVLPVLHASDLPQLKKGVQP